MIVRIFGIMKNLDINEGEVGILNIRPQELYLKICLTMLGVIDFDDQNDILILENETRIKMKDILFISDILSFEFDNKSILTKIGKELTNYINSDIDVKAEFIKQNLYVIQTIENYMNSFDLDYSINEELDIIGLLKLTGVSFLTEDETYLDKIDKIIHLYKRVFGVDCFIFRGLCSIMTFNQIKNLEDIAKRYQTSIILLENSEIFGVVTKNILTIEADYSEI